jgi:hypothetical protein
MNYVGIDGDRRRRGSVGCTVQVITQLGDVATAARWPTRAACHLPAASAICTGNKRTAGVELLHNGAGEIGNSTQFMDWLLAVD